MQKLEIFTLKQLADNYSRLMDDSLFMKPVQPTYMYRLNKLKAKPETLKLLEIKHRPDVVELINTLLTEKTDLQIVQILQQTDPSIICLYFYRLQLLREFLEDQALASEDSVCFRPDWRTALKELLTDRLTCTLDNLYSLDS